MATEQKKNSPTGLTGPTCPIAPEVLAAFQKLTDHAERKAFYKAHPELRELYSEANFH